jgi:formate hydrogenlyase subunit 3/multisubunit Na+/H+ antiporter MnhD subunit
LISLACFLGGGFLSLFWGRRPELSSSFGVGGAVAGSVIGLWPVLQSLGGAGVASVRFSWNVPNGLFHIQLDALSAFFLLPIFILTPLAAIYGGEYMRSFSGRKSLRSHWLFFNLFIFGMTLVILARHALLFLVAWEVMSLSAFFLVTFEHEKKEVRPAGWIYLIAAHVGAAFLLALFLVLGRHAGSLDFDQFMAAGPLAPSLSAILFVMAIVGFGTKAGFVPFHIWLPEAHPAAPSHVSALMSGVMIKIGIYGILRMMMFLGPPAPWWGPVLVGIGVVGALLGVTLALFQRDIKRALAYSSIENIGLIVLALGVGVWGLTGGHPVVAMLGLAGGLLHIWNHSLMKGLMFLGAGSILHATGTKDMERLGGLMARMPRTGVVMVLGALAIAAVPPLNGFVSEWLIYMSLLNGGMDFAGGSRMILLLTVGVLALVGGMAMICFVRLIGIVLLGTGRSEEARNAHESSPWMTLPLVILAGCCVAAAVFPRALIVVFSRTVEFVFAIPAESFLAVLNSPASPLPLLGLMNGIIWVMLGAIMALFLASIRNRPSRTDETWGCGYPAPTARIQYTGQSFSELIVTRLFPGAMRPKTRVVLPEGLFPEAGKMTTGYPDTMSRILYQPFFEWLMERLARLRWVQQGKIQNYMLYFVVILFVAFAWLAVRQWVVHE